MEDKWIKIGFGIFAATTVFFGVVSIGQKISIQPPQAETNAQNTANAFDEARLRVLDTDEDGLNDWEELNVHATSPYLADSDSDGVSDYDEITAGSDPNCPAGRVCGSDIIKTFEEFQGEIDDALGQEAETPITDFSEESLAALDALDRGEIPTPSQIRALLRDSGVSEEQLADTPDEDLVQLFQEVAAEQEQAQ